MSDDRWPESCNIFLNQLFILFIAGDSVWKYCSDCRQIKTTCQLYYLLCKRYLKDLVFVSKLHQAVSVGHFCNDVGFSNCGALSNAEAWEMASHRLPEQFLSAKTLHELLFETRRVCSNMIWSELQIILKCGLDPICKNQINRDSIRVCQMSDVAWQSEQGFIFCNVSIEISVVRGESAIPSLESNCLFTVRFPAALSWLHRQQIHRLPFCSI